MKKLILLALVLFSAATMLAQTNRMSYQAVVRNAANELVAEENLTVAIRISDANGTSAFSETHSVTSNRNGVISLMIGEGSGQSGNMASVDWRTAQIHTEVTLPGGTTLSNTTPVNAVPYAFYADSVDIHWVNDAVEDYLDNHSISSIVETDPTVPAWAKEATKPVYDYSEITNTPDMSGYLTSETDPTVPDWAKESVKPVYDYSEITNTPDMTPYLTIESDPTVNNSTITIQQNGDLVGSFTLNQAGDQTINITVPTSGGGGSVPQTLNISGNVITLSDGGGSVTLPAETDPTVPAWAKESTKPAYDYAEITNTPDLSGYLTTESDPTVPAWAKGATKPAYDYSEITGTPTIPTTVAELTDAADYVTDAELAAAGYVNAQAIHDSIADMRTQLQNISTQLTQLVTALTTLQAHSEAFVATNGQTAFTLSQAPLASGEVVCFVNGVMVGSKASHVLTVSGANVTYNPAYNYDYALKAGDVVTFMYIHITF